jgi:hypothetical protein
MHDVPTLKRGANKPCASGADAGPRFHAEPYSRVGEWTSGPFEGPATVMPPALPKQQDSFGCQHPTLAAKTKARRGWGTPVAARVGHPGFMDRGWEKPVGENAADI